METKQTYHKHTRAPHLKIVEETALVTKTQADAWTGADGEADGEALAAMAVASGGPHIPLPPGRPLSLDAQVAHAALRLAEAIVHAEEQMGPLGQALSETNGLLPAAMILVAQAVTMVRANGQQSTEV